MNKEGILKSLEEEVKEWENGGKQKYEDLTKNLIELHHEEIKRNQCLAKTKKDERCKNKPTNETYFCNKVNL